MMLTLSCMCCLQIALSASDAAADPVTKYVSSLEKVCQADSIFLITSCNFTEQELLRIFSRGMLSSLSASVVSLVH